MSLAVPIIKSLYSKRCKMCSNFIAKNLSWISKSERYGWVHTQCYAKEYGFEYIASDRDNDMPPILRNTQTPMRVAPRVEPMTYCKECRTLHRASQPC